MRCPYPTMSPEEILAIPVGLVAADAAHIYHWTTAAHRELAHACLHRWGFRYVHDFVWCKTTRAGKPQIGGGHFGRHAHESCLFGVRGRAPALVHNIPTWFQAPRGRHSAKPERIFEVAQELSPGPRIDIFARLPRDGWMTWGNDAAVISPIVAAEYEPDADLEVLDEETPEPEPQMGLFEAAGV